MRGSLKQRSPGVWSLIYDVPPPPGQERKQKKETFYGNKRDASKRLNELVGSVQNGTYLKERSMTVGEYFDKWLAEAARPAIAITSYERYERVVRLHIKPSLGNIKLGSLETLHIQSLYSKLTSTGYAPLTIRAINIVISAALRQALEWGLIDKDPSEWAKVPKKQRVAKDVLVEEQLRALMDASIGTKYAPAIWLAVTMGMRAGEICGLRWEDVDLDGGVLCVKRSAAATQEGLIFKCPKTRGSVRSLTMPSILVDFLKTMDRRGDTVVSDDKGHPVRPATLYHAVVAMAKRMGFKASPHDIRHAHASLLSRVGVSPKEAADRMGHEHAAMTMNVYTHLIPGQGRGAADKVDVAFQQVRDQGVT
jgi:integrase